MWKQPEASSLHLTKMVSYPDRSASNADSPNTVCKTFLSTETIFKETPVELIHKLHFFLLCFCFQGCCVPPKLGIAIFISALMIITDFCHLSSIIHVLLQCILLDAHEGMFVCMYPLNGFVITKSSISHGHRHTHLPEKAQLSQMCQMSVAVALHSSIS